MPTKLWKKGDPSPNPAGRPVGAKSFTTKVKEALEKIAEGKKYTIEEALVKSILKKAIIDGDSATQKLIWNYLDGMPKQSLEVSGDENNPLALTNINDKEINIRVKGIEKRIADIENRKIEKNGNGKGKDGSVISNGRDSGISKVRKDTSRDSRVSEDDRKQSNNPNTENSSEDNGGNDKLDDPTTNQES